MKLNMFSIFDVKAQAYITPFFFQTEGQARRTFGDCVNDSNHAFFLHPADYVLFHIGEFDNDQGVITPFVAPKSLGPGTEYIVQNIPTVDSEEVA